MSRTWLPRMPIPKPTQKIKRRGERKTARVNQRVKVKKGDET
jgi:hypothetical protein